MGALIQDRGACKAQGRRVAGAEGAPGAGIVGRVAVGLSGARHGSWRGVEARGGAARRLFRVLSRRTEVIFKNGSQLCKAPQPKAAAPKKTVSKARQKTKTNKKKRPNQQLEVNYRRPTKRSHKVSARGRLNDIFSQVLDNSEVKKYKDFFNPIDAVLRRLKLPHLIPVYEEKIPHPMCFKHIKTRCNKRNKETYYGTREEFEADVKQIATNSRLFNGPVSPVTVKAEQVVQLVLQKLREFDAELNKTTAEMRKEAGYQPYNAAAGGSRSSRGSGRDGSLVSSSIAASSAGPPSQVSIMDQDALAMDEEDLDDLMFDDDED